MEDKKVRFVEHNSTFKGLGVSLSQDRLHLSDAGKRQVAHNISRFISMNGGRDLPQRRRWQSKFRSGNHQLPETESEFHDRRKPDHQSAAVTSAPASAPQQQPPSSPPPSSPNSPPSPPTENQCSGSVSQPARVTGSVTPQPHCAQHAQRPCEHMHMLPPMHSMHSIPAHQFPPPWLQLMPRLPEARPWGYC